MCVCGQPIQGVSTTGIIIRIIQGYDDFVKRNMKRGYTGKEMNVPFIKVCLAWSVLVCTLGTSSTSKPLFCMEPQEKSIQLDMVMNKAKKEVTEWGEDMGVKVRRLHNIPSKSESHR